MRTGWVSVPLTPSTASAIVPLPRRAASSADFSPGEGESVTVTGSERSATPVTVLVSGTAGSCATAGAPARPAHAATQADATATIHPRDRAAAAIRFSLTAFPPGRPARGRTFLHAVDIDAFVRCASGGRPGSGNQRHREIRSAAPGDIAQHVRHFEDGVHAGVLVRASVLALGQDRNGSDVIGPARRRRGGGVREVDVDIEEIGRAHV